MHPVSALRTYALIPLVVRKRSESTKKKKKKKKFHSTTVSLAGPNRKSSFGAVKRPQLTKGGPREHLERLFRNETNMKPFRTGFVVLLMISFLAAAYATRSVHITGPSAPPHTSGLTTTVGDFNGDTILDFVVGSSSGLADYAAIIVLGSTLASAGISAIDFSSGPGGVKVFCPSLNVQSETFVGAAGDINNDGFDDLLIGASSSDTKRGAVYVVFGFPGPYKDLYLKDLTYRNMGFAITGAAVTSRLSSPPACLHGAVGDVNGDDIDDIALGDGYGTVFIVYGKPASAPFADIDLDKGFSGSGLGKKLSEMEVVTEACAAPVLLRHLPAKTVPAVKTALPKPVSERSLGPPEKERTPINPKPVRAPTPTKSRNNILPFLVSPRAQEAVNKPVLRSLAGLVSQRVSLSVRGPAPSSALQSVAEAVRQPAPGSLEEPVSQPAPQPVAEPHPVAEPVSAPAPHPVAEPVSHPVSEPAPHPVAEPVSHPVAEPVSHPVAEPVSHPVSEPVSQPAPHPMPAPVPHPVSTPASEPVHHPVPAPAPEPAPHPVSTPASEPVHQPAPHPMHEPAPHPVPTPVSEPVSQPVAVPVPEPVSQPAPTPVAEPVPPPVAQPVPPVSSPTRSPAQLPGTPTMSPSTRPPSAQPVLFPILAPVASPVAPTMQPSLLSSDVPISLPISLPVSLPVPAPAPAPTAAPTIAPTSLPPGMTFSPTTTRIAMKVDQVRCVLSVAVEPVEVTVFAFYVEYDRNFTRELSD
jgi:hypothetical protein